MLDTNLPQAGSFPSDFLWGTSTSAYQVEGAIHEDGRGESIWDHFCRQPGAVARGENGDIACDHYHRVEEDIALLADLGVNAYRFSIAWPRIIPRGRGAVEPRGLSFYSRIVDLLLARGIQPVVTLYHWDLPQLLEEEGGWRTRRITDDFEVYADIVSKTLGDRVKYWATINEPWCVAMLGHAEGAHAPGLRDPKAALAVAHHLLIAHGRAVDVLRANVPNSRVGIVLNLIDSIPASDHEPDRLAAYALDGDINRWFLDPLFGRTYPADRVAAYQRRGWLPSSGLPFWKPGDEAQISKPIDYLGINYYTCARMAAGLGPDDLRSEPPRGEPTEMKWEVYPEGLYTVLTRVACEYQPRALMVTENGASYSDGPDAAGVIRDRRRVHYLESHIGMCARALAEGVPLKGYFVWSLMDNFEWAFGYNQRFGIVWIDYNTQRRIPKNSYYWYREYLRAARGIARTL